MSERSIKAIPSDSLYCRVMLSPQEVEGFHLDILSVEVWCPADLAKEDRTLQAEVLDVTEGVSCPLAVRERPAAGDVPGEVFSRERLLNPLPPDERRTARTTTVQIDTRQLYFARRGVRRLVFKVTLRSKDGARVAECWDDIEYDNSCMGYLEWRENCEHIRLLTVQLVGALTGQGGGALHSQQSGLLRGWLLAGIDLSAVSPKAKRIFEKTFRTLLKVSRSTDLDQIVDLAQDMGAKSTAGQRQEILEFSIHIICLSESLSREVLCTLQDIAVLWDIDPSQFSVLLEKVLSTDRLQDVDRTVLAGMAGNMSVEGKLKQLNSAYARWNARITHADKAVRQQAEEMLTWIALTREQLKDC